MTDRPHSLPSPASSGSDQGVERRGSPDFALILVSVIWAAPSFGSQAALRHGGQLGLLTLQSAIGAAVLALVIRAQMGALTQT